MSSYNVESINKKYSFKARNIKVEDDSSSSDYSYNHDKKIKVADLLKGNQKESVEDKEREREREREKDKPHIDLGLEDITKPPIDIDSPIKA